MFAADLFKADNPAVLGDHHFRLDHASKQVGPSLNRFKQLVAVSKDCGSEGSKDWHFIALGDDWHGRHARGTRFMILGQATTEPSKHCLSSPIFCDSALTLGRRVPQAAFSAQSTNWRDPGCKQSDFSAQFTKRN